MEKKIGILGGMGPLASAFFYNMITEHTKAEKDQDHIQLILLSDPSVPDRTKVIESGSFEELDAKLLANCRILENAGCDAVCATCNTAHFFMNHIEDQLNVPLLHMINLTAESLKDLKGERIGIMATDGTIKTKLYQSALEKYGLEPYTPSEDTQNKVMYEIYGRIKAGERYNEKLWGEIEADYRQAGCKHVILACTELSVIKQEEKLGDYFVDAMEVLAKKVIEFAGKEYK